ncbi:MAG: peptidylprolyl isomerase [Bacteroidales bacterium]
MRFMQCLLIVLFFMPVLSKAQGIPDNEHDYLITLSTDSGEIKMVLYDETPMHKMNFAELAEAGVYDNITFHRVIDNFMIQTGDPDTRNKTRNYDPSIIQENIPAEIRPQYGHIYGAVGAARRSDSPGMASSGSQFYIIENTNGAEHLDKKYTVFGQVVSGFRTVHKIAGTPTDESDTPKKDIRMTVKVDTVERSEIEKFYDYDY